MKKNISNIVLAIIIIFQLVLIFFLPQAQEALAEVTPTGSSNYKLNIPVGALSEITKEDFASGKAVPTYISTIYRWGVGFTLILGVIALMFGGTVWVLAGGSEKRVGQAQGIIKNSLVGIFLALGSYLFLWTISPNLVQFRPIILSQVKKIKLALVGKNIPPGQEGKVAEYNALSCPTAVETEFDAYFTVYYKPPYGEKRNYEDFWCNTAMQCWCPDNNKRDQTRICKTSSGYEWHPCVEFPKGTPYCTSTSSGAPPIANYSLAADQTCFKVGCKLQVNGKTYEVKDKGDLIKGRHFDLYAGGSLQNADFSGEQRVKILNPTECLR